MSYLKRLTIVGVSLSFLLLVGCEEAAETTKKVTEEVEEAVQAEVTKDNEFVLSVKEGSLSSYPDVKVKDAFDAFFSSQHGNTSKLKPESRWLNLQDIVHRWRKR